MQLKIIIVVLFTSLIFLSGCVTEQTEDENQNELIIPGTGACQTILRELASSFNESNPSYEVLVPDSTGSSGGIRSVGEDEYILGRVAREIKNDEMDYGLSYLVFAKDVVVFAVSENVEMVNLSTNQIIEIFSGNITNWNELGGSNANINIFIREQGDSSLTVLQSKISAFNDIVFTDNASMMFFDYEMVDALEKFPNSIGFLTGSSLIGNVSIKKVELDGILPDKNNIENGKYNLTSDYAFVYKQEKSTTLANMFIDFVFSNDGAQILENFGLISVNKEIM